MGVQISPHAPCYNSQMNFLIVTIYLLVIFFFTIILVLRTDGAIYDICVLMFRIHRRLFGLPPRPKWKNNIQKISGHIEAWIVCKLSPKYRPKWIRFFLD